MSARQIVVDRLGAAPVRAPSFMTPKPEASEAKGRVKEAAGALTGDRRLKNQGRVDQAKSSAGESTHLSLRR